MDLEKLYDRYIRNNIYVQWFARSFGAIIQTNTQTFIVPFFIRIRFDKVDQPLID